MRVIKPRSPRTIALVSSAAGLLNLWLALDGGAGMGRAIGSSLFMAAFMAGAFLWMNRWARPDAAPAEERDSDAPPPPGGWATQTTSQRARDRAGRALNDLMPRRNRPRRRR